MSYFFVIDVVSNLPQIQSFIQEKLHFSVKWLKREELLLFQTLSEV